MYGNKSFRLTKL